MIIKKQCERKLVNGGDCGLPNIQCAWPRCEEAGEVPYEEGMRVYDNDGNIGAIDKIIDAHNIHVKYDLGGSGLHCVDKNCKEYDELHILEIKSELKKLATSNFLLPKMMDLIEHYQNRTHHAEKLIIAIFACKWWQFSKRKKLKAELLTYLHTMFNEHVSEDLFKEILNGAE
jgi:hypothetical protein